MRKIFASFAFGCRVNIAEKEALDKELISLGFKYSEDNPDIYFINTCAVTRKAEREARQFIYKTRKKNPKAKIIITGCAATKWLKEGIKINEVDKMIDNENKEEIINTLILPAGKAKKGIPRESSLAINPTKLSNFEAKFKKCKQLYPQVKINDKFLSSGRLLLKIQDGCQRFCTYCIVPYLRGTPKSKKVKDLVLSIKHFENNISEVILAAINTEAYGWDTGEKFTDLLESIINHTKIPRISLGSLHPWSINYEFFDFYKKILPKKRLVNFFHIPLQSGSNKILTLMKRGYTREEFLEKLNILAKINPFALIGTDIIVGFLDETEKDFADTFDFLKESPISKFHIFRFSIREKTAAYYMSKTIKEPTAQIKIKRAKILADLGKIKYQKFLSKHLGKIFPALFLQKRNENYQEALLDNQVLAFIKAPKNISGQIKDVKIEKIKNNRLIGKMF